MPFQPMAEKARHPLLSTGWSLTARPDEPGGAVEWQRAPAVWVGKSGGVFWGGHPSLFSAGSKMKGSCRLGAQAAMIRHLVVEKFPCPLIFMNPTII
jgi:hypothetical protein